MAVEDNVVALARPPVRQTIEVNSSVEHTFEVFVREIAAWWPVQPFSYGADLVRTVTFERRTGGRFYETWVDGTERDWGRVLEWRPPEGFTTTWNVTGTPTEVALRFLSLAPELTRVELEHRGWDRLSEEEITAACALPGGYDGGAFDRGWAHILGCFVAAAEASL